jgi:hypothetical protein
MQIKSTAKRLHKRIRKETNDFQDLSPKDFNFEHRPVHLSFKPEESTESSYSRRLMHLRLEYLPDEHEEDHHGWLQVLIQVVEEADGDTDVSEVKTSWVLPHGEEVITITVEAQDYWS